MVLHKRLDYGFNGYQVPPTPRATRSARKRKTFKEKVEQDEMCAFDLLAIVAGNLLHEKDISPGYENTLGEKDHGLILSNTVKCEGQDEKNIVKAQAQGQGSPSGSFIVSELLPQGSEQKCCSMEPSDSPNNLNVGIATAVAAPEPVDNFASNKLENDNNKKGNVNLCSLEYRELDRCKLDGKTNYIGAYDAQKPGNVQNDSVADMCISKNAVVWDGASPAYTSSNNSIEAPLSRNHNFFSYPPSWDDVNIDSRDDDENSSGCTHPKTTKSFFKPTPRIGDRRIRKILASKYWNVSPRMNAVDWKPLYNKRRTYYKYQRPQRLSPFKKKKQFGICSKSNSEGRIRCGLVRHSPKKGNTRNAAGSDTIMHGGNEASQSVADQQNSFQSRDSHVKLRIKSFKVPELFIEVPENATVGTLKRMILDAVNTLLEGGLRVDVLLQGKKVRDDNKTLLQTGISQSNRVDALGFSLESNSSETRPSLCPVDSHFLLSHDTPQPLTRCPPSHGLICQTKRAASPTAEAAVFGNFNESNHDSDVSIEKSTTDSKALVPLEEMNVEALAVVPPHQKSKRCEIAQRRIRRPFSVAEVEALVQAVEKLGTGRWRDVKLRAFENAKHRTYVDLKDKWKTLVHTARIAPQQRRGEPVPQELLDRVLTAHAYWSQQQAKHQQEACLLF